DSAGLNVYLRPNSFTVGTQTWNATGGAWFAGSNYLCCSFSDLKGMLWTYAYPYLSTSYTVTNVCLNARVIATGNAPYTIGWGLSASVGGKELATGTITVPTSATSPTWLCSSPFNLLVTTGQVFTYVKSESSTDIRVSMAPMSANICGACPGWPTQNGVYTAYNSPTYQPSSQALQSDQNAFYIGPVVTYNQTTLQSMGSVNLTWGTQFNITV